MTDKELVERLRLNANCMMDEWEPTLCKRSEFITAADRIEQLHAELTNERIDNTNLIGELATVTAERDRYKAVHENPQPLTLEEVKEHITKGHPMILNHCMWILNLQFQLITLHDGGMHIICLG